MENKQTYMAALAYHLKDLQKEEFDDAIEYIEEYFNEAGDENEAQVIEELGPPHKLAATIRAEATIKKANTTQQNDDIPYEEQNKSTRQTRKRDLKNIWIIILGIFALPIGLPIIFSFLAIILSFFLVIFSLIISGICIAGALVIIGIPSLISSIALLGSGHAGLLALGISFIFLGAGILGIYILVKAIRKFIPWMTKFLTKQFHRFSKKSFKQTGGNPYEE